MKKNLHKSFMIGKGRKGGKGRLLEGGAYQIFKINLVYFETK